ncbi:MAG: helix-turn-helix transcriptional regulator [Bacteroidota bacterium]
MGAKRQKLLPKESRVLENLGENIKLARLRRKLTMKQVAERANLSRKTLWHIEKGSAHISIGNVLQVLSVLGFRNELGDIASNDLLGRKLQDMQLLVKKRGSN